MAYSVKPSKRAQFVHGTRVYSAHNRLHVNAPASICAFLHNRTQLLWSITLPKRRRFLREPIKPSARTTQDSIAGAGMPLGERCRGPAAPCMYHHATRSAESKPETKEEAGTQFVPRMRAYSAHNRLHVKVYASFRFACSYRILCNCFGASPTRRAATILRDPIKPSERTA